MTQNNLSLQQTVARWRQQQPLFAGPVAYDSVTQWLDDIRARACWIPMPDLAAIVIAGADADKFLQGQLTCDVRQVTEKHWLPSFQSRSNEDQM